MTAISAAIDRIFADPNMAADATWTANGTIAAVSCRVILKSPDAMIDYGDSRLVSDTVLADVRVSQVSEPKAGDLIMIGAESYLVQGAPRRDRERLVWTMELVPQCS